jgi:hypothetical protein
VSSHPEKRQALQTIRALERIFILNRTALWAGCVKCDVSVGCPLKPDQGEKGVKKKHPTLEDMKGHACESPDDTA